MNEIAFRIRGPGERGGAHVIMNDCATKGDKAEVEYDAPEQERLLIEGFPER